MKPTLVLDLDETLVHSTRATMITGEKNSNVNSSLNSTTISVDGVLYYVAKRPHVEEFLTMVSQWYNLVVFTASLRSYADPVIDILGPPLSNSPRFYRSSCFKKEKDGGYIKDINLLGIAMQKLIVLDNSPISFSNHRDNAILISGWTNDKNDRELLYLLPLLMALSSNDIMDIRSVLCLKDKLRF